MALSIKSIPVLKGEEAKRFEAMAEQNLKKRDSIDFTKESKESEKILLKAKLL